MDIHNIHKARDALKGIMKAVSNSEPSKYFSLVEKSGWFEFLNSILSGARKVAISLLNGINVLVHCSDGWDRTAQLLSLA